MATKKKQQTAYDFMIDQALKAFNYPNNDFVTDSDVCACLRNIKLTDEIAELLIYKKPKKK